MKFTLLVKKDENNYYSSYDKHEYGGVDIKQQLAFYHIFGSPVVDECYFDYYLDLVELHGWDLKIVEESV